MNYIFAKKMFVVFLLVFLAVLLYYPALSYQYVWDDTLLFLDNTALLHEPLSWSLLARPVLEDTSYLRPLVFLSWFAEFKIFSGADPQISHAINIAIHSLNGILVFLLALFFSKGKDFKSQLFFSALAGVIYICHPAVIEAAAWVSGRFDLMCTTFILLACYSYVALFDRKKIGALFVTTFFLLSLFSKELGAVLPGLIFCLWFVIRGQGLRVFDGKTVELFIKDNWLVFSSISAAFLFYLFVRIDSPGGVYHIPFSFSYLYSVVLMEQMPLHALRMYAVSSVFPFFSIDPIHPYIYLFDSWLGYVLNALALGFFLLFVFFGRRFGNSSYWLLVCWFISLFPVLHFVPLTVSDNIIHQRFLTAPLAFFSIAVSLYLSSFFKKNLSSSKKWLVKLLAIAYVLLCALILRSVLPIWSSDAALWGWAYKKYPESKTAFNNYIYGLVNAGGYEKAFSEIEAIRADGEPLDVDTQILYSILLTIKGDEEALLYIKGVVEVLPKFHDYFDRAEDRPPFYLNSFQLASAYSAMATAQLVFNDNIDMAINYNEIAQWYLDDSEKKPLWYQRLALDFLAGNHEEFWGLLEKIKERNFYSSKSNKTMAVTMVEVYCEREGCDNKVDEFVLAVDSIL